MNYFQPILRKHNWDDYFGIRYSVRRIKQTCHINVVRFFAEIVEKESVHSAKQTNENKARYRTPTSDEFFDRQCHG